MNTMEITAKFPGRCRVCGGDVNVGDRVEWQKGAGVTCLDCLGEVAPVGTVRPWEARRRLARREENDVCECCGEVVPVRWLKDEVCGLCCKATSGWRYEARKQMIADM